MTPDITIRVDKGTIVISSIMFLPALFMGGLLLWRHQQILDALTLCGLYFTLVYWMASPCVELADRRLVYRSLFIRKEIDLTDVSRVSMRATPAPTLNIHRKGKDESPFTFIIKPFSKHGIRAIFQYIRESNPSIEFDSISKDMSNADFDSITRATLSTQNILRLWIVTGGAILLACIARLLWR